MIPGKFNYFFRKTYCFSRFCHNISENLGENYEILQRKPSAAIDSAVET